MHYTPGPSFRTNKSQNRYLVIRGDVKNWWEMIGNLAFTTSVNYQIPALYTTCLWSTLVNDLQSVHILQNCQCQPSGVCHCKIPNTGKFLFQRGISITFAEIEIVVGILSQYRQYVLDSISVIFNFRFGRTKKTKILLRAKIVDQNHFSALVQAFQILITDAELPFQ